MLSHALQIKGCIIYASKNVGEWRGAYCYKASVKSLNMSQLGSLRSDQMEVAHGRGGTKEDVGQAGHD